jgi:hypothetical protein
MVAEPRIRHALNQAAGMIFPRGWDSRLVGRALFNCSSMRPVVERNLAPAVRKTSPWLAVRDICRNPHTARHLNTAAKARARSRWGPASPATTRCGTMRRFQCWKACVGN